MLAALNHQNIAQIYGVEDITSGEPALIMELVEGTTLADRMAAGALPLDEALSIAVQIAEALEAAHEKGIVHRDLKPANAMITPAGVVKVLDFGVVTRWTQLRLRGSRTGWPLDAVGTVARIGGWIVGMGFGVCSRTPGVSHWPCERRQESARLVRSKGRTAWTARSLHGVRRRRRAAFTGRQTRDGDENGVERRFHRGAHLDCRRISWHLHPSDQRRGERWLACPPDKIPATAVGKWTISSAGGDKPRWSGDGKELYYIALDRKMMAVPVKLAPTFEPGIPIPSFETNVTAFSPYDVSPDGRFLLNTVSESAAPVSAPVTLVLNWQQGLKRSLP